MKPLEDDLLDAFKESEDSEKPFVVTGTGNVIVNVRKLNSEVIDIRDYARQIVEKGTAAVAAAADTAVAAAAAPRVVVAAPAAAPVRAR
jgi:hypothetical protein